MPLDPGNTGLQHHLGDGRGEFGLPLIAGVQGDPAEDDNGVGVEHAEDEVGVVGAEASFERGGGVSQVPDPQQLAAPVVLEQVQRPALTCLLGGTDAFGRRGQRLVAAVHDGQDSAAKVPGQPQPVILAEFGAAAQGSVRQGERRTEVAAGVLQRGFTEFQYEPRGAVAGLLDGLPHLREKPLCLAWADGDDQAVEELDEQPRTQVRRQPGEVERPAARLGAYLGRNREQAGDAEPDLGLLPGRERLAQRAVGEGLRLHASARGAQEDGGAGHQRAAQRMGFGGQVERPASQVGRLPGIGAGQDVGRFHQRRDGDLVAGHGAGGELGGDLHRERAGGQQRGGYLPVEGMHGRGWLAGAHRLPVQVMGEAQHLPAVGQYLAADELLDGVEQGRGGNLEDRGQLGHGEPASHRRGDGGGIAGSRRHAGKTPAHALPHPQRKPGLHQRGVPPVDADQVIFTQTGKQLKEEERVALYAIGQGKQRVVGGGAKDVSHHLGDSGPVKVPEHRPAGSVAEQFGDGAPKVAAGSTGRKASTHPTGREARRDGRVRIAALVPLSAHCKSSRQIRIGWRSADCSSSV